MKAARLYGPKDLRLMDVPIPNVGDDDVLIRVKYCGVCGTDYSIYSGESSFIEAGLVKFPMTLGHEYSGVIEKVGKDVTDFAPGDRVVADTGISCGCCDDCREGNYLRCEKMQAVGTINAKDGGYAEYTSMPQRHVFRLPDDVSLKEGAIVEPVATGLYSVLQGEVGIGDDVLIIGTGPIGLGAVPFVKLSGAKKVILAGRKPYKLDIGKQLGADYLINTVEEDIVERVMDLTDGKGADVIIESSGSVDMFAKSTEIAAIGCRISVVAFYEQLINNINMDLLVIKDIKIHSVMGSPNMGPKVIQMMESKKTDFTPLITEVYPFKDVNHVLENFRSNNEKRIKVLLEL